MHEFSGDVLVAEDSPTNQVLIRRLLEKMGFEVTIAEDGNVALQKTLTHSFDMIFVDIQTPNMNGYEATKAIRTHGVTTPIVALTASAMPDDEDKCIRAGCDDYLSKPIDRKKLLTTIQKFIPSNNEDSNREVGIVNTQASATTNIQSKRSVINWDSIMNICGAEDTAKEIAGLFLTDAPECMELIATAIESENTKDIEFYAHRLRGMARHMAAEQLEINANHLECAGRKRDEVTTVEDLFEQLQSECEKVISFLSQPNWIEIAKQYSAKKHQKVEQETTGH